MMREFWSDLKRFVVTLRFSILTIFVALFSITILLLISYSYYRASTTMLLVADKLMEQVSAKVIYEIGTKMADIADESVFSAKLIERNVLNVNNYGELVPYLYRILNRFSLVQSVFWSDEQGNFIIAEEDLHRPPRARLLFHGDKPANLPAEFYDENKKVIPTSIFTYDSYDPRTKIYYNKAKQLRTTIWTDVYAFQPSGFLGVTIATPVIEKEDALKGVFGMGIRLDHLSQFLTEQEIGKNGIAFVVKKDGTIIAFPNWENVKLKGELPTVHTINIPWLEKSFEIYKKNGRREFTFTYKGQSYLARYDFVPHFIEHNWLIGVVVPEEDFVSELRNEALMNALIGLGILLLGIVLVSHLVTRVVEPLKKLVVETKKIQHFELDDETHIYSRIKEVSLLSNAIHSMKMGLKSFMKYVPSSLVRQLIESDEAAHIGGSKRPITIFFSDIANFTTIAEAMDADELVKYLCEYFNELSNIILQEKGTIDKFIGDSIMAFWGAPKKVDHPQRRAALVALACVKKLNELNRNWEKEGKQPFYTRIGLNSGEAIVGNVGSTERINYTAVGDAVNLANRLEGINKNYGTQILVSESVYEKIKKQFALRKVDRVTVKGKTETHLVYELLAENKEELSFDLDAYNNMFEQGFAAYENKQWNEAIRAFDNCLKIFPADTVAPIFIRRCEKEVKEG